MPKKTFGDDKESQRDRCLEIAARASRETGEMITPTMITRACIKEGVFSGAQLLSFQFQMARRLVERWLKTPDSTGLPTWGQLPLTSEDGEMVWERRDDMKLDGYAWNYILRDDVATKNQIIRDRWRREALLRWSESEFDVKVEYLRAEAEREPGAA